MAGFDGRQITQPVAFLAGSLEPILAMIPGVDMVELSAAVEGVPLGSAPLRPLPARPRPGTAEQDRAGDDGSERHNP